MRIILIFILLVPFKLSAKVISSSANGFIISIEQIANVSVEQAYNQFIKIDEWWSADHTYSGKSDNLFLDPKAGGCFCEIDGIKQVHHMLVTYIEPNKEIRMTGGLGPLQMMGVHGGMSWKFESIGTDQTKIIHKYSVSGFSPQGLDKLAPIVDQVQQLQVDSLVKRLNDNSK